MPKVFYAIYNASFFFFFLNLLKTCYMPDTILGTGAKNINKIEFDILWMSACNSEDRYLNKLNTTW